MEERQEEEKAKHYYTVHYNTWTCPATPQSYLGKHIMTSACPGLSWTEHMNTWEAQKRIGAVKRILGLFQAAQNLLSAIWKEKKTSSATKARSSNTWDLTNSPNFWSLNTDSYSAECDDWQTATFHCACDLQATQGI